SDTIELDLGTVEPSLAGPKRPQDRVPLSKAKTMYTDALSSELSKLGAGAAQGGARSGASAVAVADDDRSSEGVTVENDGEAFTLRHGAVVIAAITSCTNTSNPSVMLAAGLLARNAVAKGLRRKPWVKTSLAPGSKVVTDYLNQANLQKDLDALGFQLVGYGCTTCIGNSGPLSDPITNAIESGKLVTAAVLSGNRNFEGRVNPLTRFNYLASPPLVVAYAIAGRMDLDLTREPLGVGTDGPVFLRDVWPSPQDVQEEVLRSVKRDFFERQYADVFKGDEQWQGLDVPSGETYTWDEHSTYVKNPPYFDGMTMSPPGIRGIAGARALAVLGDSITTDHISPAGNIPASSPAGTWLIEHGVEKKDFNSYGARRGNHEVMMRGTFANIRLRNEMVPGTEGGWSTLTQGGTPQSIYDVSMAYQAKGTPLVIVAGKEYGTGSSRDWAAKGTILLGVRAVIAESFERIHRSNLVGMGVLPLEFANGDTRQSLGITGFETFDVLGLNASLAPRAKLIVRASSADGTSKEIGVVARIDTPEEMNYYRHGGILPYVLRQLVGSR
ncbi:MAG TPA: aconitate hydratase AcnA, partial [Gemmatimonadaceae bacterium]|nr:aconitate hydratase AcnA [Gemmatimonadaceae bacterium]